MNPSGSWQAAESNSDGSNKEHLIKRLITGVEQG